MAKKTAILSVRVVSDTKNAQRGAQETATAWEKFEKRLNQATIVSTAVGAALVKLGKDAYAAASDLQQSTGAVETVFKDQAAAITDFATTAWESVGLSQNKAQEMATIMGSQLKNLGVPMEQVAGQSLDLIKLGADLAATYGGPTSDAVEALSSLLRGERNPIERYGVTITQAMVNAEKAALGLEGLTGAADRNADMQATLSLLTKQTADAQGQFAREADTAAGAAQRNAARWETVQAQLGTALLPIMTQVSGMFIELAGWVAENSDLVMKLAGIVAFAAAAIISFNVAIKATRAAMAAFKAISAGVRITQNFIAGLTSAKAAASAFTGTAGTLGGRIAALTKRMLAAVAAAAKWVVQTSILIGKFIGQKVAQLAVAAATKVAAAAQKLWNAIMNANPILLIITLVVAAITLLVMNWEKVSEVALTVWQAITDAVTWFWETVLVPVGLFIATAFVATWEALRDVVVAVWEAISDAASWLWNDLLVPIGAWLAAAFVAQWVAMKKAATAVWSAITTAANAVWSALKSVGDWIAGVFVTTWNNLKSAGETAINALISPIQTLIGWLKSAWDWVSKVFEGVGNFIGNLFGFSAAVEVGAPAQAALGLPPSLPSVTTMLGAAVAGDRVVNVNIEMPNYVGDRRELLDWLRTALKQADQRSERLIRA